MPVVLGRRQPGGGGWEAESSAHSGHPSLYLKLFELLLQLTAQGLLILNPRIEGVQLKVLPVGKKGGWSTGGCLGSRRAHLWLEMVIKQMNRRISAEKQLPGPMEGPPAEGLKPNRKCGGKNIAGGVTGPGLWGTLSLWSVKWEGRARCFKGPF